MEKFTDWRVRPSHFFALAKECQVEHSLSADVNDVSEKYITFVFETLD